MMRILHNFWQWLKQFSDENGDPWDWERDDDL